MEQLIEKLSRYHLLNNLIPGVLFLYLLDMTGIYCIDMGNVMKVVFLGYIAGMVISRVGSVIVEPFFQVCKIVKYAPYQDYIKAEIIDKKIPALLVDNNVYRTLTAMFLLLLILFVGHLIPVVNVFMHTDWATIILLTLLLSLYVLSYRKQTAYVRKRVNKANNQTVE